MSFKNWITGKNKKPDDVDHSQGKNPHSTLNDCATSSKAMTLADIARGMQHAATAANQFIAHQYQQTLDPFFERGADGALTPKTVSIQLDSRHHIELPLVALSTPRGLMLEKMKVQMTVRTDAVNKDEITSPLDDYNISNFHVSMSPSGKNTKGRNSQHVDIEMQFTALEPPESIMRLIDEYTNLVLPKITQEEKNNG
ncbi:MULTISPECIES: DUF2589 domain-containing protein [Pectobacterium]|uniref:DUF2589 domain-containing protein n=1 Tax=Pectobacterium carotovorum subsp. carotovorum (strain PC1) TaxID=561230 RepID=C6DKJ9_PECCP|nr:MULTISPECIES: DUF2589 domain-containing protein [Pectobacterium]ACT11636.1 hypothetical protein PC1_0581 [Pectobacterium carotovorum subsp. carotovorum PC1]MBA0204001.1 DUF2589 domain-containing protein [Pectobacterium aroidearum]MBA5235912.1 DUF2589 domain-containing protein [Pectobacterium aroidearum]MDY4386962.1 DUF2589 domain-containing protein [Pectobacterium aroidearum]UUE58290.1 DUF2589 domain-containing protein [Pectobacterium aroidearum]